MQALQELRARIGALEKTAKEFLPCPFWKEGLPRGAVVELTGPGKTEAVARLLAQNPDAPTAWVEKDFCLFPSALEQRNVSLAKVFFVEGKKECGWAATTILRSQLFPFLVYSAPYGEEKELRRFLLLAEKSRATMILLGEKPSLACPIALSLEIHEGRARSLRRK